LLQKSTLYRPILRGSLLRRSNEAIRSIASSSTFDVLQNNSLSAGDCYLAQGSVGLALFYAYLSKTSQSSLFAEEALRYLNHSVDVACACDVSASLFNGLIGVAWVMNHLSGFLFDPDENSCKSIDQLLWKILKKRQWDDVYDLISGLVGLGVYSLDRLPSVQAKANLERVIDHLEAMADITNGFVTWHTAPEFLIQWQRELCPQGHYNLGLAHGIPGVIAFLARAHAAGIRRRQVRRLYKGAVKWLLAQRLEEGEVSCFSHWIGPDVVRGVPRLAWCYGDVGLGAALLFASRYMKDGELERIAIDVLARSTKRKFSESRVTDADLCHGATGIAHIFHRVYQATKMKIFLEASLYWFEQALNLRVPEKGVAGFSIVKSDAEGNTIYQPEVGLLSGVAGIGLALLSAATGIEPSWDRVMLISIPP
jgi:lantibiotic modifying enzyme